MFVVVVMFFALYVASFLYIANRFLFVSKAEGPVRYYFYALAVALSIISIIAFMGRRRDHDFFTFISPLCYIIMGVWAITISFSLLNELVCLINTLVLKITNFRYYSTMIILFLSACASIWSLFNVSNILNINEITIPVSGLQTPSLKIAQLSDIHINANTRPSEIRAIFEKTTACNPDIIVLTGDIIDTDILSGERYKEFGFEQLRAPGGVYAVTGNHDHYTGAEVFYQLFERLGIKVLKNENMLAFDTLNIAGINDISFNRRDLVSHSLDGCDGRYPVLFLSHRPESFDTVSSQNEYTIVQLSGHTHGGQIPPVEIARRFFMKYNFGVYRAGNSVMYVSSGARWWGPPMRFGSRCEIAVITLVPQPAYTQR